MSHGINDEWIGRSMRHKGAGGIDAVMNYLRTKQDEMVARLSTLVELESPSNNKAAVDQLGQELAREFERLGGKCRFHRAAHRGDHLQADFAGAKGKPVLLLGHMDTVWDVSTIREMPFRIAQGRAWGPGAFDMKAGIVQGMAAIEALCEVRSGLPRAVTFFLVTDEEVGSETSRKITESLARKAAAVLVLEPAHGSKGALKTARKGVGDFTVKVTGRAAHSGLDFEKGASAVVELARQVGEIATFTDLKRGITVNPGVIRGGTRANVIAAEAVTEVDARIWKMKDAAYVEKKFRSLKPFDRKCKLEVTGGINRPPLERSKAVAALYGMAQEIAGGLGFKLDETAVGGGSDGNFTAALGIPTLDGLGAVGEGAHAKNESVVIEEMPRRAALVARLIEEI
jgi:glutamate carboxypeptidase